MITTLLVRLIARDIGEGGYLRPATFDVPCDRLARDLP